VKASDFGFKSVGIDGLFGNSEPFGSLYKRFSDSDAGETGMPKIVFIGLL
jgi:hypothetical protein